MSTVKQAKEQAKELIKSAVKARSEEILESPEFQEELKELRERLQEFENDPYSSKFSQSVDESGELLESRMDIRLGDLSEEDNETIFEVLTALNESVTFIQDQYSQGNHEWTAVNCLGEFVWFDPSPDRHCFSIFSKDLGLELKGKIEEEHGLAIIEQAMRKHGIFNSIAKIDRYGSVASFIDTGLGNASDSEVAAIIARYENQEEQD
jgi:hypothetical protein